MKKKEERFFSDVDFEKKNIFFSLVLNQENVVKAFNFLFVIKKILSL